MEKGIVFDLYDDEKIVKVIRRHWIAFAGTIAIIAALMMIFFVAMYFADGFLGDLAIKNTENTFVINLAQCGEGYSITSNLSKGFLITFGSMYLLSVIGYFYISWLDFYLDVFVLTNKRIMRFEQIILFGKKVSETSLRHVQDVSSKVNGIINTVLNTGTVFVETAGENENFSFALIKNPGSTATEILELQKNLLDSEREDLENSVKDSGNCDNHENTENVSLGAQGKNSDMLDSPESMGENTKQPPLKKSYAISNARIEKTENMPPKFQRSREVVIQAYSYKDGRMVTPNGVIWQSEQELTEDILGTLNEMEK